MKILFTADIHASMGHLQSMLATARRESVDVVIIGGDLVPHHLPGAVGKGVLEAQRRYLRNVFVPALRAFRQYHPAAIYADLSNDDYLAGREHLQAEDGGLLHLLHMRVAPLNSDVDLIGFMVVPPTPFARKDWEKPDTREQPYAPGNRVTTAGHVSVSGSLTPRQLDLSTADTIEADLERLSERVDRAFVFVSHCPPFQTPLDMISGGQHVGSLAIRRFIERWARRGRLLASLHGHIHESPLRSGSAVTRIAGSLSINPGQGNGEGAPFGYALLRLRDAAAGAPEVEVLRIATP
jgi:Icc-related predicted phosphoesterase